MRFQKTRPASRTAPKQPWDMNLVDSLKDTAKSAHLDEGDLFLGFEIGDPGQIMMPDRSDIRIFEEDKTAIWRVERLQDLFRGDREPPSGTAMERYPAHYVPFFVTVEAHLMTSSDIAGDPLDEDMIQIYGVMRSRPDGRSLSIIHDCVWQAACFAMGLRPYSQAEYEAVFRQLARSVRRWRDGMASRNYITFLRDNIYTKSPRYVG